MLVGILIAFIQTPLPNLEKNNRTMMKITRVLGDISPEDNSYIWTIYIIWRDNKGILCRRAERLLCNASEFITILFQVKEWFRSSWL